MSVARWPIGNGRSSPPGIVASRPCYDDSWVEVSGHSTHDFAQRDSPAPRSGETPRPTRTWQTKTRIPTTSAFSQPTPVQHSQRGRCSTAPLQTSLDTRIVVQRADGSSSPRGITLPFPPKDTQPHDHHPRHRRGVDRHGAERRGPHTATGNALAMHRRSPQLCVVHRAGGRPLA